MLHTHTHARVFFTMFGRRVALQFDVKVLTIGVFKRTVKGS